METERRESEAEEIRLADVAVRSFRLWKLKELEKEAQRKQAVKLQFVRSDCGN